MKNKALLQLLIQQTQGRFFSVKFRTKSGQIRIMNAKDKYLRLLSANANSLGSTLRDTPYVPAVSRNDDDWRSINSDSLIEFTCGSMKFVK